MVQMSPRILLLSGVLAFASANGTAFGQIPYDPCACAQPIVHVQAQSCYQTVPVTEYHQVKQTVQKPVVETAYVDQPVTEYHPVVENKTQTVPTVSYQNVTECQAVQRDMGRWVTTYQTRQQMTPCEYDGRPGLLGALNRQGYSMRMAFTPKVTAQRQYCPNVVTQMVPVTRQVAIQGTRTVNYQVTRMVPVTTTRKVAVNTVRMVAQEVTVHTPVTTMRTVPIGTAFAPSFGVPTATAFAPTYAAPAATAFAPTPVTDPASSAARPTAPKTDRSAKLPPPLNDEGDVFNDSREGSLTPIPKKGASVKKSSYSAPVRNPAPQEESDDVTRDSNEQESQLAAAPAAPTATRVGGWIARRTARPTAPTGPAFPDTVVAGIERAKR